MKAGAGGLKLVKDFLDKELKEDDLSKMVRVWEEFEDCKRGSDKIDVFLSNFERCYNAVVATSPTSKIPAEIRAFMVLKSSGAQCLCGAKDVGACEAHQGG